MNRNYLKVLSLILLSLSIAFSANEKYLLELRKSDMECEIHLNNIFMFSSYSTQYKTVGSNIYEKEITPYLKLGTNDYTVKVFNIGKSLKSYKVKKGFCEIKIIKNYRSPEGEIENEILSSMRIQYKLKPRKVNQFDSTDFERYTVQLDSDNKIIDSFEGTDDLYPFTIFEKTFDINSPLAYQWGEKAKAITEKDKPLIEDKLWAEYKELSEILQNKDKDQLISYLQLPIEESANALNITAERFSKTLINQKLSSFLDYNVDKWTYKPIHKDDYQLEQYADKKLFRFVKKGTYSNSPIVLQNKQNSKVEISYDPIFMWTGDDIEIAILE